MNKIFIAFLFIFTISYASQFYMKDNKIYDKNGGVRIFHGVNLVQKVPPYYDHFEQSDAQKLKSWGINGLRLGVMWPGVQPKQNFFNNTYLQKMISIVNLAGKYNIYTLVEFHQDLFSEKFCADGVPMWAVPKSVYQSFPIPLKLKKNPYDNQTGLPTGCGEFPWAQFYFTKAVNQGFGHLWKNKNGLLDKFALYWKKVAEAFKGNEFVIGFELMNQPWPGNLYENPLVMVPGLSEKIHLQSAYDYLSKQIRSVDPEQNICFEPVTWLNGFQSGFDHPPGGLRYSNSSIFCYHYYSPPTLHPEKFMKSRVKDVKKLNSAGILSEFYIIGDEGVKNVEIMDECDKHSHSWFGWLFESSKNNEIVPEVIRTFAHRVAGDIVEQVFVEKTKQYRLVFNHIPDIGETVIFINKQRNYKNGFSIELHPKQKLSYIMEQEMYIRVREENLREGERVMISISEL